MLEKITEIGQSLISGESTEVYRTHIKRETNVNSHVLEGKNIQGI